MLIMMTMETATEAPEISSTIRELVEVATTAFELLAIVIVVAVILLATVVYIWRIFGREADTSTYKNYRHGVARALLLGLEILVAADVIRTVALEPTLHNVLMLGVLVLIRTFLGWSLVVEIEERWPWQPERERGEVAAAASGGRTSLEGERAIDAARGKAASGER
jgi:uncharacterized membrane protein